jgi:hypothetical protein
MALIPVNNVEQHGGMIASTAYDTDRHRFTEVELSGLRLPIISYLGDSISFRDKACVLLGKCESRYVVSFGENRALLVDRRVLGGSGVNYEEDDAGQIRMRSAEIPDLSGFFNNDSFVFLSDIRTSGSSLPGLRSKFLGYDVSGGKVGVVKFDTDAKLKNEVYYKIVGDALSIPVCRAELGKACGGEAAVISYYEYNCAADALVSFRKLLTLNKWSLQDLLGKMPEDFTADFYRALLLDYIMEQADRHMSNLAVLNNEKLYPLFDNGSALGSESVRGYSEGFRRAVGRMSPDFIARTLANLESARKKLPADVFERIEANAKQLLSAG